MTKQKVEQAIYPRWLVPVNQTPNQLHSASGRPTTLEQYGLVIDQGIIVAIAPRKEIENNYQPDDSVVLEQHAVTPGLINAHTHSAMTLLRGFADDLPLMQWLSDYIWPAESKSVNREFVQVGTDLAIAEMLRSGTTCFNDMYFFPDVVAACAQQAGMRACVGMIVLDVATAWANDAEEYIAKGLATRDALRHSTLVRVAFAPHAPYTVADPPLEKICMLADELGCQIHIHLHETADEVEQSNARYGMRPIERLDRLGLISPKLAAVHMTQLLPTEITTIAERGVNVVHCPQSNLKLSSGFSQIQAMLAQGINVAIGTDGASSNNDLDMLAETQSAAMLAKAVSNNPSAMNAYQALYCATMAGAIAMGIDAQTGSLEIGKAADLIAINLNDPSTLPVFNPLSQIVYSASRSQVSDVWVAGKRLLKARELTSVDINKVCADAVQWGVRIAGG